PPSQVPAHVARLGVATKGGPMSDPNSSSHKPQLAIRYKNRFEAPWLICCAGLLALAIGLPRSAGAASDRVANEADFFALLRYDAFPAPAAVKTQVDQQHWPEAKAALLQYMRDRNPTPWLFDAIHNRSALVAARDVQQYEIDEADGDLTHNFTF